MIPNNCKNLNKVTPLCLGIFLLFTFFSSAYALPGNFPHNGWQAKKVNHEISGQTLSRDGQALSGVTIILKGTSISTMSDENGNFKLSVPESATTLLFSYVGYKSREIRIQNQTVFTVILDPDVTQLAEVVAIGYGTQKNANLTSAVAKLEMKKLDDRPITSVDKALIGQLAGVRVQETSGKPGSSLAINIRGIGSINGGTGPLYVVDGIPLVGGLDNISTNDIESIEVLKDAASAAIYGSRGANGVVIVTTKKGKIGNPVINLSTKVGMQQVAKTYTVLNRDQWIDFAIEERTNSYLLNGGDPNVPGDSRPGNYRIDPLWTTNPKSFPDNNWQDIVYRNALFQDYHLSISGGNDKIKYYLAGDYIDQDGLMINSNYKRYSFNTNVESQVNSRLKFGLNINTNVAKSTDPASEQISGPVSRVILLPPVIPLHGNTAETGFYPYSASFMLNPFEWAKQVTNPSDNFRTLASLYGQVDILEGLSFRSSIAIDLIQSGSDYFMTNSINRGNGSVGSYSSLFSVNVTNENVFNYNADFGKHHINAIAGFTAEKIDVKTTAASATGFPDETVRTLNAATNITSSSSFITGSRLLSYLARGIYNYNDRYLLSASIRRDGSSKFGINNKWGLFPSVSAGWRISEEDFMKNIDLINNLKIRGSYGTTGNNSFPGGGDFPAVGLLGQANYVFGAGLGNKIIGLSQSSLSNPDLTWEKKSTIDWGLDAGLFGNRISLSLDIYRSVTKDLLVNVPIPEITGFRNAYQNVGEVENTGYEIEMNAHILTGEFKFDLSGNFSHNKNTVKALGANNTPIPGIANGFQVSLTEVGQPIGAYYLIPAIGIFQTQEEVNNSPVSKVQNPGDIKYKDSNGDGIIDDKDRQIVGHNNPDYTWGITPMFQFHNFDLAIFLNGEWGNNLVNVQTKEDGQSRGNVLSYWLDRWRSAENPGNGRVPRAAVTANLTTASTFWMFDAGFWRIRNISLGYNFKKSVITKIPGFAGLRVYFNVENLATFDNYFGSPQTGAFYNNPLTPGIDGNNTYPLARTFTFGMNFTFK